MSYRNSYGRVRFVFPMFTYTLSNKFIIYLRNFRSKDLFVALKQHCRGKVLDVGGGSFFLTAMERGIECETWTSVEYSDDTILPIKDPRFTYLIGDGCSMPYADNSYDTVLSIQVLEHTFEPIRMFNEIVRVLKPGGKAIILVPQTGTLHLAPHHYQNFTRFWLLEAARRSGSEVLQLKALGGWWSSIAAKSFYFFFSGLRRHGNSTPEIKRNMMFYILFPLQAIYAVVTLPICLFLGLGDLEEDPNNHLMVIRKK